MFINAPHQKDFLDMTGPSGPKKTPLLTAREKFSVFLDSHRIKGTSGGAYIFQDPIDLVIATNTGQIEPALAKLQKYLGAGYYVAGWLSYEAGLHLERKLQALCEDAYRLPFLSFGVFERRQSLSSCEAAAYWDEKATAASYEVKNSRLNISRTEYETAVLKIHDYLRAGDVYQVNFTLKSLFDFDGSPASYFADLRRAQQVEYGAFLTTDDMTVLSLSPELFFDKRGDKIITRPMKGTCRRGRTMEEDHILAETMRNDAKSRAENLMIVDLLRNDLSRISVSSTVQLKKLYEVEKYRTLFQMTSTIEAQAPPELDFVGLMQALFPCGSVTGAPKIRAMEIISELEKGPRGIYTGAIGYMAPDGTGCFSVPIRTMTIDRDGRGEMGIGSAIVADSDVGAEYDECLLKADFATRKVHPFDLIESLAWRGEEGYRFLDHHLDRLRRSAVYFEFPFPEEHIRADLHDHAACLTGEGLWKVRLLLSARGEISITSAVIMPPVQDADTEEVPVITLSAHGVDSHNVMLFHKTTDRAFYDRELHHHQQEFGSYDVVFVNEKGQLTEGAFNTIFVKRDGVLYTPSLTAGVLEGVLRRSLLEDEAVNIREGSLVVSDLALADEIYMGNSVRGLVRVTYLP